MSKTMKVTENLSSIDNYYSLDMQLWITPGSSCPYWARNASFMHDEIVAHPHDFLEELGYDSFDDDADYEEADESATIEITLIPFVA